MTRHIEYTTTISEQAMSVLSLLPAINLAAGPLVALSRAVISVQERLQIEPYALPTLSDLVTAAKYAQMNAYLELDQAQDIAALAWADVALTLWDDAVDQSLTGTAVLDLLGKKKQI